MGNVTNQVPGPSFGDRLRRLLDRYRPSLTADEELLQQAMLACQPLPTTTTESAHAIELHERQAA